MQAPRILRFVSPAHATRVALHLHEGDMSTFDQKNLANILYVNQLVVHALDFLIHEIQYLASLPRAWHLLNVSISAS
eukprot:s571_g16.t2